MQSPSSNGSPESLGTPVQEISDPLLKGRGIRLLIKRDDLIHPHISGNKWRKLKYNLAEAIRLGHDTLLTFGGAYSNHIAATAFACGSVEMSSIGIIRGEDDPTNPTLQFARENGMELHFVSREDYRVMTQTRNDVETRCFASPAPFPAHANGTPEGETPSMASLRDCFGHFFLVPEGGANALGVRGCSEILPEVEEDFDIVCCAAGTGTTLAGLALSLKEGQRLIGFPALKGGEFLLDEVKRLAASTNLEQETLALSGVEGNLDHGTLALSGVEGNVELATDYHFGGYAKVTPDLLYFIHGFNERTGIPLDPIYTGKMMYGIYDMIKTGQFKEGSTVLAIHTGGLQGWQGMRHRGKA